MKHFMYSVIALFTLWTLPPAQGQNYTVLHSFDYYDTNNGGYPYGSLTLNSSTLFGMTSLGDDGGKIFQIGTDGGNYSILHSFAYNSDNGARPFGGLTLKGSMLYGMTLEGGNNDGHGTVFGMSTNGNGFTLLHSFAQDSGDGANPFGNLTLREDTLYGMTSSGGSGNNGTVFKIDTDGQGYSILHSFPYNGNEGALPKGSLTLSGSTLYGITNQGGGNGDGTIFKINTDGSGFDILHSFQSDDDGYDPRGSLTLCGSTLYGMTSKGGGIGSNGTIFKINTDGSEFTVLHSFLGGSEDGKGPYGSLTLNGSTLYGMTSLGGTDDYFANYGTIFQINTDGSDFKVLHSFLGGSNGWNPQGDLVISDSTLYGMTLQGGDNDWGVVFALTIPEPSTITLLTIGIVTLFALRFLRRDV